MASFIFDLDKAMADGTMYEVCGVSKEQAEAIYDAVKSVMNENLDLSISQQTEGGLSVKLQCSVGELAAAAAEKVDVLTPEIAFYIGTCVSHEMNDRDRHVEYLMRKSLGSNEN